MSCEGIQELLDQSIAAVPFTIGEKKGGYFDLSKIDFEALRKKFDKNKPTNTDLEHLKAAVRSALERMVRLEPYAGRLSGKISRADRKL